MKCLLWNLKWAASSSKRGHRISEIIASNGPDTICLTETTLGMVPSGFSIESQIDYGYPNDGSRRKVVLWSRSPWAEVDDVGASHLPPGRFVTGVTEGIRFVGVCIPWKSAHVSSGRRDRKLWQDHLQYLEGLRSLLARFAIEQRPVCVLGDFNQRIPAFRQPSQVGDVLRSILGEHFRVSTAGFTDADGCALIDHVAATKDICVSVKSIPPKREENGLKLSDHAGLVLDIVLSNEQHFPSRDIRDLMTGAALRFNGYASPETLKWLNDRLRT